LNFKKLYKVEDRHFWFRARNRVIAEALRVITKGLTSGYRALEIGCGTGNTLRVLKLVCDDGFVVGMDLFFQGLRYAQRRSCANLVQADATQMPFRGKFHIIALFDVIEHLPDDIPILQTVHSLLEDNGTVIVTVPAHQSLWSNVDVFSGHRQRYEKEELELKLAATGYNVEYITEFMTSIYPLIWLSRKLKSRKTRKSEASYTETEDKVFSDLRIVPVLNRILYSILGMETLFIRRRKHLPIGTSILALACKISA